MSSAGQPDDEEQFDAEEDLLRRYEQMVQTQISTLNGIDDKAAHVARLVAILSGLILSAASLIASTRDISITIQTGSAVALVGLSVTAFVVCIIYAVLTYLSSKFEYGPSAEIGKFMSSKKVDNQQYKDVMLRGYANAIQQNKRVVVKNARRFQTSLAALLMGLIFLFGGAAITVLQTSPGVELVVAIVFFVVAVVLGVYVHQERYLTLDRSLYDDD